MKKIFIITMYLLAVGIGKAQDYKKTVSTNRHEDLVIPMDAEKNKRIISQREALNASKKKNSTKNEALESKDSNIITSKVVISSNGKRVYSWGPWVKDECYPFILKRLKIDYLKSFASKDAKYGESHYIVEFKNTSKKNVDLHYDIFLPGDKIYLEKNGQLQMVDAANIKVTSDLGADRTKDINSGETASGGKLLKNGGDKVVVKIINLAYRDSDGRVSKKYEKCANGGDCFTCKIGGGAIKCDGNTNENAVVKNKKSENKKIWVKPGFNENWQSYNNYIANEILTSLVQQGYSFTTRDINDRWQITKIYSTTDFDISVSKSCYQKEMGGTSKLTCTELVGDVRISVKNKAKLEEIKKIFDEYSISIY